MTRKPTRRTVLAGMGGAAIGGVLAAGTSAATESGDATLERAISPPSSGVGGFVTTTDPTENSTQHPVVVDPTAESDPDTEDTVAPTATTEVAFIVGQPESGRPATDDTLQIWAGVIDTEAAVGPSGSSGVDLTIEIERPDGNVDEFTESTDADGRVNVSYSPAGGAGQYTFTVSDTEGRTASDSVDVGPVLEATTQRNRNRPILAGKETTFQFLLRDGQSPLSGTSVTLTATHEDGSVLTEETVTTDADGFAGLTIAPTESGWYTIDASATVDGIEVAASSNAPVSDIGYEYDFFDLDPVRGGREVAQGGQIRTADGPLENTDIQVQYTNESADIDITRTTTTDEAGFFAVAFEAPTGVSSLDVAIETTDGRQAALGSFEDSVSITEPDAPVAAVDASIDDFQVAPGGTTTLEITANEADGSPIADETVGVLLRFDSSFGPPLLSTTTETNVDGEATLSVPIPTNAPPYGGIRGGVVIEHDGEQLTDSIFTDIRAVDINLGATIEERQLSIDLEARDPGTDDPVADIQGYTDAQYIGAQTGSFDTSRLVSDGDGTATITGDTPEDLAFLIGFNHLSLGDPSTTFFVERGPYPGQLSSPLDFDESAQPGTELSLTFDIPAESAVGLLYGEIDNITIAEPFDTATDELSVAIPTDIDDDRLRIRAWAVGSDGQQYAGSIFEDVDADADPDIGSISGGISFTDELLVDPVTNPVTVAVSASGDDGEGSTVLDIDANTNTSPVTYTIDDLPEGAYAVTAEVTAVDGDPDRAGEVVVAAVEDSYEAVVVEADETTTAIDFDVEKVADDAPDEEQHESGVSEELFDAVDQDGSGQLSRGEIRNAVEGFVRDDAVDGIGITRSDVRNLVEFFIRQ